MPGALQHIRQVRLDAEAAVREFRAGDTSNTERLLMRMDRHARDAEVALQDIEQAARQIRERTGPTF